MPLPLPQVNELVRTSRSTQPRTIIAFLFGMSTLIVSAAVVVAVTLIGDASSAIVVGVFLVGVAIAVAIVIAVLLQLKSDPSGLMLGQITGTEYESIRKLTLGDSASGERSATLSTEPAIEGSAIEAVREPETEA